LEFTTKTRRHKGGIGEFLDGINRIDGIGKEQPPENAAGLRQIGMEIARPSAILVPNLVDPVNPV
jgi:hypothetical protein